MELPKSWGDLATYCLPSFPPIIQDEKAHNPDDYVDLFPPPIRPSYVLHDSSMVTRILEGLTDYVRERDLTDMPLKPRFFMFLERLITETKGTEFADHGALRSYTARRICPIISSLLEQAEPSLPVTLVRVRNSEMHHGGCDMEAMGNGLDRLWSLALNFERSDVLDNHLADMFKVRRLENGSLSDGSAIVMKMAVHILHNSKGTLHNRFGVIYSGDKVVFSELCRRPDGSIAVVLSDCHHIGPGRESQIPFIAMLAFLLLPCSVVNIKMPSEDALSLQASMLPFPKHTESSFGGLTPSTQADGESIGKIILSFAHPTISPESRIILPCSFFQSIDDPTSLSSDSFLWDFYSLHVQAMRKEQELPQASDSVSSILLNTPLRRPYDMTWGGIATFADGSVKPVVVKMACGKDLTSLAREAEIYETLAKHTTVVAPTYYGSYFLQDYRLNVLKGCMAAMIILEDAGTQLPGYDGWDPLSLKGLKSKQIGDITRRLEGLHTAGFQHNDFASRNVLVNEAGDIRLIDFGRSERHECPGRENCDELQRQRLRLKKIRPKHRPSKKVSSKGGNTTKRRDDMSDQIVP